MASPLHVRSFVRTLISYPLWILIVITVAPLMILMALFPAPQRYVNRWYFRLTSWASRVLLAVAGVRVTVTGTELLPSQPCVMVMNHASALDIVLIEALRGEYPRMWMSKHEYDAIPFFSFILRRMHMLVDAEKAHAAARSLIALKKIVDQTKSDVLLFPEGARFSDGNIHQFFPGFATLARQLNRVTVPVYIANAHKVFAKDSFLVRSEYAIHIVVGPAMARTKNEDDKAWVTRVRAWFKEQASNYTS